MDKLTPEDTITANAIDLMAYHTHGKTALSTIPDASNLTMFNTVSQSIGHDIIHLLMNKCSLEVPIEFNIRVTLGQLLVSMFFLGVYMAEHDMAKLGESEKTNPMELQ